MQPRDPSQHLLAAALGLALAPPNNMSRVLPDPHRPLEEEVVTVLAGLCPRPGFEGRDLGNETALGVPRRTEVVQS